MPRFGLPPLPPDDGCPPLEFVIAPGGKTKLFLSTYVICPFLRTTVLLNLLSMAAFWSLEDGCRGGCGPPPPVAKSLSSINSPLEFAYFILYLCNKNKF